MSIRLCKKLSVITDSGENSLDYGEGVIKYCVNLSNDGKVTGIKVAKGDYYLEGDNNFLNTAAFETIKYGEFFTAVINFLIMAVVIFAMVKVFERFKKKEEPKKVEAPKKNDEVLLLEEIRDLLKKNVK